MGKMTINYSIFRKVALDTIADNSSIARVAFNSINDEFYVIKNNMINEFENHPVTLELKGGPTSDNKSGTIAPEGNLFSFIGFDAGFDPTDPIRDVLSTTEIYFAQEPKYAGKLKLRYAFPVKTPTFNDIKKVTPMPQWTNGSWVERIERSIPNIKNFLYYTEKKGGQLFNSDYSRSTAGIQIKGKLGKTFERVLYMSEILQHFNSNLLRFGS